MYFDEVVLQRLVVDADEATTVIGACEIFGVTSQAVLLQSRGFRECCATTIAVEPENPALGTDTLRIQDLSRSRVKTESHHTWGCPGTVCA